LEDVIISEIVERTLQKEIKEEVQEDIHIVEEELKPKVKPLVADEIDVPDSFILELYKLGGLFFTDPEDARKREPVLHKFDDKEIIVATSKGVTHTLIGFESTEQASITLDHIPSKQELEGLLNNELEYLGLHELWHLFRFKITKDVE
jgi:hypothetical protein